MMTEKILKIAKGLGKFHTDEMCIISELPEEDVLKILEYLITEQVLKKVGTSKYHYNSRIQPRNKKKTQTPKKECQPKDDIIQTPFIPKEIAINTEELQAYPEWAKKKALKYLKVIEASKGLYGKNLQLFLKQWNRQYPEMKVGYSSLMREKRKLIQKGVSGLVAQYGQQMGKSSVSNELYQAFRDLYLSPQRLPAATCWRMIKAKNPQIENFPSQQSFVRRLKKDFTEEEIQTCRSF